MKEQTTGEFKGLPYPNLVVADGMLQLDSKTKVKFFDGTLRNMAASLFP